MSITLEALTGIVRRSILDDTVADEETGAFRWSDEEIKDYIWWALDTFCAHTAVATATSMPADSQTYAMPDNLYVAEELDITGRLWLESSEGERTYLNPIRYSEGLDDMTSIGFYTRPRELIHLQNITPAAGSTLHVEYYAFYDRPYVNESVINIPRWAETAISYLTGVHALSNVSLKTALIRRWNNKNDSGNPEQNTPEKQQKQFQKMVDCELQKYPQQDRANNFRDF